MNGPFLHDREACGATSSGGALAHSARKLAQATVSHRMAQANPSKDNATGCHSNAFHSVVDVEKKT